MVLWGGYTFDPFFQTLYNNWGPSALNIRTGFLIFLALELGYRSEYDSPDNFVNTCNRGVYKTNPLCIPLINCVYKCDNACTKTQRNIPLQFDFIILGAGAAGSTLARQLLDSPKDWSVLLVEAGGDPQIDSVVPYFFTFNLNNTNVWNHYAQRVNSSSNAYKKGTPMICGKQLGGGTATNAMMYVCGNDRDYDGWAALGNTGWSYNDVLPYIKKSEGNTNSTIVGDGTYHGTTGGLTVSNPTDDDSLIPLFPRAYFELGYKILNDYNARQYNGFVRVQSTIRGGERCSSYRAFIAPVMDDANLYIMKYTLAVKINFNGAQAASVTVQTNCTDCPTMTLIPNKEVIVSSGGFGSPQILQRSGIGKAADLTSLGIPQIKDLNVGYNFQDHVFAILTFAVNPNSTPNNVFDLMHDGSLYYYNRSGAFSSLTTSHMQGFINTLDFNATYPEIQIIPNHYPRQQVYFEKTQTDFGFKDEYIKFIVDANNNSEILTILVTLLNPYSKGSVKISNSSDPNAEPIITSGYFTDPRDVDTMVRGIQKVMALMNTTSMRSVNPTALQYPLPECDVYTFSSDDYWKCYIKYFTTTLWHPTGTCKMGPSTDPDAVVGPNLKVAGFTNLRVVDASIMPFITTGNTQCPTYMIAQKAADLIKADWP